MTVRASRRGFVGGGANDDGRRHGKMTQSSTSFDDEDEAALCARSRDRGERDSMRRCEVMAGVRKNGKEKIEVRHLMSHHRRLHGWEKQIVVEDLYDWDKVTGLLAEQAPWWEAGPASGYHAITQGNLVGEVVRRISGLSLGQFFAKEVAGPLGADFHIGLDAKHDARVADLIPPEGVAGALAADPSTIPGRVFRWPAMNALDSRTRGWRAAEIPAANGHGNARSIARIHSVLANGGEAWGSGSVRLRAASESRRANQRHGLCWIAVGHGTGFGMNSPDYPLSPNPRTCYWRRLGWFAGADRQDANLVVAFAMKKMNSTTTGDLGRQTGARCTRRGGAGGRG